MTDVTITTTTQTTTEMTTTTEEPTTTTEVATTTTEMPTTTTEVPTTTTEVPITTTEVPITTTEEPPTTTEVTTTSNSGAIHIVIGSRTTSTEVPTTTMGDSSTTNTTESPTKPENITDKESPGTTTKTFNTTTEIPSTTTIPTSTTSTPSESTTENTTTSALKNVTLGMSSTNATQTSSITSQMTTTVTTTNETRSYDNQTWTTATPMTTTFLPTIPPDYVHYPISSNYYFPDLNINATSTGQQEVSIVPGPFGFGNGVQLTATNEDCLTRSDFYNDDDLECFQNPGNCSSGISISIWENILFNEVDESKRYILSTGGDRKGVPGVALYHKGVDMHAVVSNGSHYWYLYVNGQVPNNTWSNIGLRWKHTDGLELYVDKERVGKVVHPTNVETPSEKGVDPPEVAVGCHVTNGEPRYKHFSDGRYDELALWMHYLNDTEIDYFLGGYDSTGANMSVEDLKKIIETQLNLSDPEQQKQAVDILNKMTQDVQDDVSERTMVSLENIHNQTLSSNGTSQSKAAKQTKSQNEEDAESQEKTAKLYTVSGIIQIMTNPTKIKKNLTIDEMASFQGLLSVVSSTFSLQKKQEWLNIQKSKPGSSTVVCGLQDWTMAMLQETNPIPTSQRSTSFGYEKFTDNIVLNTRKIKIRDYENEKGLTIPDYSNPNWINVLWSKGSPRVPLDSVQLNRELFADLNRKDDSNIFITNFLFGTYDKFAPTTVNTGNLPSKNIFIDSKIISMQMEPTDGLDYNFYLHPVVVTLKHNKKEAALNTRKLLFHNENQTIPTVKYRYCATWNPKIFPLGGWDASHCEVFFTNEEYSICHCEHMGTYAIIAQNIKRRDIHPDPEWLACLKYILYGFSFVFLIFYICVILIKKQLKDQFHIIRINMSVAALAGTACMFATDYVRDQRHECTAVTAVLHYAYVAVACWLLMEAHALFSAIIYGVIGGKLKSYIPFAWGCPMIFLGYSFLRGFQNYGLEPRCLVSWDDELKWALFAPNLVFSFLAILITLVTIINISFAAVKKDVIFEDISSVAWGLLFLTVTFFVNWIFACLAYLDIELMYPDFYPIFQVLNAGLGLMIFLFMGIGSKRFRTVLRGDALNNRHFPLVNQKDENLVSIKPQPKRNKGPIQG